MISDFEVEGGIYVVQGDHKLDLHNDFDFQEVRYSVAERSVSLWWRRGSGDWVRRDLPTTLHIQFDGIKEFRFVSRDSEMPFTEDDCLSTMGFLTDDPRSAGRILVTSEPEEGWLTAFKFQSGAVIALRAERAIARIGL